MVEFEYKRTTPIGGDETAAYDVRIKGECTLLEFIRKIVSDKSDWGSIRASYGNGHSTCGCLEYSHGNVESNSFTRNDLGRYVKSAKSVGGWYRFDYDVELY